MRNTVAIIIMLFCFGVYGQSPEVDSERFKGKTNAEESTFPVYSDGARLIYNQDLSKWRFRVAAGPWQDLGTGGGGGGGETLAATLVLGNNTGGSNIVFDADDRVDMTGGANSGMDIYATTGGLNIFDFQGTNGLRFYHQGSHLWTLGLDGLWQPIAGTAGIEYNNATSGLTATTQQAAIDELAAGKTENTIPARLGSPVAGQQIETEAQLASNGAPAVDEIVFCSDCAPIDLVTASTLQVNDYVGYDDRATDAPTFTFSNVKAGAIVVIEILRASDATYSGITFVYTTGTFEANTRQIVSVYVLPSGDAIREYKTIQ